MQITELNEKIYQQGDAGYDDARRPFKLTVEQRPARVMMAESVDDVVAAVRFAREQGMPFAVQATGHGLVRGCTDGVLVNTARFTGVQVDPARSTARVNPGTRWRDVLAAGDPLGLIGLSGTAPSVGVVGYTLGGGVGLLMRTFGYAADSVIAAEIVTADGQLLRADRDQNPDLLWALKGGGGNFGVITALEFKLHPVRQVYSGVAAYPAERASEFLRRWAAWTVDAADDVTSAAVLMRVPPFPAIPESIRGKQIVMLRAASASGDATPIEQLRAELGTPLMDTYKTSTYLEAALASMDPDQPVPVTTAGAMIGELSDGAIDHLIGLAGPDSPLMMVEVRHLGGASRREPEHPSAISHRDAGYTLGIGAMTPTAEEVATVNTYVRNALLDLAPYLHPGNVLNWLPSDSTDDQVRAAFSDATYARLREIKRAYDPDNVFRFTQNIPPAA